MCGLHLMINWITISLITIHIVHVLVLDALDGLSCDSYNLLYYALKHLFFLPHQHEHIWFLNVH